MAAPPKSGIVSVDKPLGMTSHQVVQAIRRAARVRRVGHAGTLDPLATGVLVVCLGSATRVIQEIQDSTKSYSARIRLGQTTSTYDAEGEVTSVADPTHVERADVEAALGAFRGTLEQVPPMYSAIRRKGKRLYEYAREGVEVERSPRTVHVHRLELVEWNPPDFELAMDVSKGTYVRSIAHDLGEKLGVGAHLAGLVRTAVGRFELTDATCLEHVVEAFEEGWWDRLLKPLDEALLDHDALIVDDRKVEAVRHGQQIDGPAPSPETTRLIRAYDTEGRFIALLSFDGVSGRWQPDRVFPSGER